MSFVENEAQFRFPIAFQIVFAAVTAVMVFVLPESPRWVRIFVSHKSFQSLTL
jgi:hypothetical protein